MLAQLTAAKTALFTSADEAQADLLRRLKFAGVLPSDTGELFYKLRSIGNRATHSVAGEHAIVPAGEAEKVEYDGVAEDAYRKKLTDYKRVKPLNARDIKKAVGSNLIFLRTLFKVPAEFGKKIQETMEEA